MLEILVALVVVGISYVAVLQILAGGFQSLASARDLLNANSAAQSFLEQLGRSRPLSAGQVTDALEGGLQVKADLEPLLQADDENTRRLYRVNLEVAHKGDRLVSLQTIRLFPEVQSRQGLAQ